MSTKKTQPSVLKTWWIWHTKGVEFRECVVEAFPVKFSKTPDLVWYAAKNPLHCGDNSRKWMIAESGTGYVLAFGHTQEDCKANAAAQFTKEKMNRNQADIRCLLLGQQDILRRFLGGNPGFTLPQPEKAPVPLFIKERFRQPQ